MYELKSNPLRLLRRGRDLKDPAGADSPETYLLTSPENDKESAPANLSSKDFPYLIQQHMCRIFVRASTNPFLDDNVVFR